MPDIAVLNILNYFDFWSAVPLDGSASPDEIAKHTSLPVEVVNRTIGHAITIRLFSETDPGKPSSRIQHTSRSAALAKSPGLRALVSTIMDDAGPPMGVTHLALDKHSRGKTELKSDIAESAFVLYHSGALSGGYSNSWQLLEEDGEGEKKGWRQRNFVVFMRYLKEIFRFEEVVIGAYDWKSAGKATVVDVRSLPNPSSLNGEEEGAISRWNPIKSFLNSTNPFPISRSQADIAIARRVGRPRRCRPSRKIPGPNHHRPGPPQSRV